MFLALAFLGAAVLTSEDSSYIKIIASERNIKAGEQFEINVYVGAHVPINAVNISLKFPENQIEIKGIDIGKSVITLWTQDPYVDGNAVILQGGTFRKGFVGEHLIATINAKAIESGAAQFSTDDVLLVAGDGDGTVVKPGEGGIESITVVVANEDGTIEGIVEIKILTDIDGDGKVSLHDISVFMSAWFTGRITYDFNGDKRMTFIDFAIILADSFRK